MRIRIEVPGEARAQPRGRHSQLIKFRCDRCGSVKQYHRTPDACRVCGGKMTYISKGTSITHDPAEAVFFKNLVSTLGRNGAKESGLKELLDGCVWLIVIFHFDKPKSARKSELYYNKRKDLDNLIKAVKDGLNKIVWKDDCRVVQEVSLKPFAQSNIFDDDNKPHSLIYVYDNFDQFASDLLNMMRRQAIAEDKVSLADKIVEAEEQMRLI